MSAIGSDLVAGDREISSRLARYLLFDKMNRDYLRWQVDQFEPYLGRRILEVGVGVGTIIELLGDRDLLYGIDVEEEVLDFTTRRFADQDRYRFALEDVTKMTPERITQLSALQLDTLVCINVLEHIQDDDKALQNMAAVLQPGGHVCLLVPAHMALYGAYDALDGHFRRYSRLGLVAAIRRAGLEVEKSYYFNAVGAVGWWYQYRLRRKQIHGGDQFGIMNRMLPAVRAIESRIRPPFGLSVVAVCRKPR